MAEPRVSVVVPVLDAADGLARCLDALEAQTYPSGRTEIVFVDNGSTDGSREVVRARSDVRLLLEPVRGAYAARNRGVRECTGEIVAFTDPDCVPEPDWIERAVRALDDPTVGIVVGRTVSGEASSLRLIDAYVDGKHRVAFDGSRPRACFGHTNNMAVRRSLLEETGGFVEVPRGGDTIFVGRAVARHGPGVVRYEDAMRVRHTEIDDLATWLGKMKTYGRSFRRYETMADVRALDLGERWTAAKWAVERERLRWLDRIRLFGILAAGLAAWWTGRWFGGGRPGGRNA